MRRNAQQLIANAKRGRRDWYRVEAKAGSDEAVIYIYDEIGWFGTTADDFVRELRGVEAGRILLHLNSPGGEVFDGIAIHTALKEHAAEVEVRVDALAASIASVIAMAGDRVVMARGSTFMIHEPFTIALGDAAEMRKQADVLDQLGDTIAGFYADRAGGTVAEWRARMHAETWLTDRETVELGLAEEVAGDDAGAQDSARRFDLSLFKHPPSELAAAAAAPAGGTPTKRDAERALRDAGLSAADAKAILAGGWGEHADGDARDAQDLAGLAAFIQALTPEAASASRPMTRAEGGQS